MRKLILLLVCVLICIPAGAQVQIAPQIYMQFLDSNGVPLAGGFLFTYAAGTTTLQTTYTDSTGTIANANPIPLDSSGVPSNGSTETGVWLSNLSYKFCTYNASMVLQRCIDNVTSYLQLLNQANSWTFAQTFTQSITDLQTDNQLIFGTPGNQTTLDLPPPANNVTLHTPNTSDTLVGRATTDTLTNKTLNSPTINSPTFPSGLPASAIQQAYANSSAGTGTNLIAKLVTSGGASQAQTVALTDTGGAIGICVSGCGGSGNAQISTVGQASCAFDSATTAGDYAQISTITAGDCHDAGNAFPSAGQVIGRVLSTNASAGTYSVTLFGLELRPFAGAVTILQMPTNQTVTGTSPTNITGLSFTAVPSATYHVSCALFVNQSGGIAEAQWAGTASPTTILYSFQPNSTLVGNTLAQEVELTTSTTLAYESGSMVFVNGAASGTVQLQVASNVGGGIVNLQAGSYCTVQ